MKKALTAILALCLATALAVSASAAVKTYKAPAGAPVIDGEIDELWNNADWTVVDLPNDGEAYSDAWLRIKLMWDGTYLYFLADAYDDSYNPEEDMVEIYLDEKGNASAEYGTDDSQTRFRLTGAVVTGLASGTHAKTSSECKVKDMGEVDGRRRVILEGAMKWTLTTHAEGDKFGIEFMYNDAADEEGTFIDALRWNVDTAEGDPPSFMSTEAFGRIELVAADAAKSGDPEPTLPAKKGSATPSQIVSVVVIESTPEGSSSSFPTEAVIIIAAAAAVAIAAIAVVYVIIKKKKK